MGKTGEEREKERLSMCGGEMKSVRLKKKIVNAIDVWNSLMPGLTLPVCTVLQKRVEKNP